MMNKKFKKQIMQMLNDEKSYALYRTNDKQELLAVLITPTHDNKEDIAGIMYTALDVSRSMVEEISKFSEEDLRLVKMIIKKKQIEKELEDINNQLFSQKI